jgi:8-oxo-dGTP diphosphatase
MNGCDPANKCPELLIPMPFTYVSCGILVDKDRKILISTRPKGKNMDGLWEFPGGKMEKNEVPEVALARELEEELGIQTSPSCMYPLTFTSYRYPDKHLIMFVFICRKWNGIPLSKEGQQLKWINPRELSDYNMPPANFGLISAVRDNLGY